MNKNKIIIVSVFVVALILIFRIGMVWEQELSRADCKNPVASASIAKAEKLPDGNIVVELIPAGVKEVQQGLVSSSSPLYKKVEAGKTLKLCYKVE